MRAGETFSPSKTEVQYWKQEQAGSRVSGWYGLISGADHPVLGWNVATIMWSVVCWRRMELTQSGWFAKETHLSEQQVICGWQWLESSGPSNDDTRGLNKDPSSE